jgi:hypothetical protein
VSRRLLKSASVAPRGAPLNASVRPSTECVVDIRHVEAALVARKKFKPPEFKHLEETYGRWKTLYEQTIKAIPLAREDILRRSLVHRTLLLLERLTIPSSLVAGIIVWRWHGLAAAALATGAVWTVFWAAYRCRLAVDQYVLRSIGPKWTAMDWLGTELPSKLVALRNTYNAQYERLCVLCKTYPPDWDLRRYNVLARDGNRCTKCGWPSGYSRKRRELHVHHVKSLAAGGDNSEPNLVTLCHICHREVDRYHARIKGPAAGRRSRRRW